MPDVQTGEWFSRRVPPREELLECCECGAVNVGDARGWRAYRVDGDDGRPELELLCARCSGRDAP